VVFTLMVGVTLSCDLDPTAPGGYRAPTLSTTGFHTCYLSEAGTYCWGVNTSGQAGDGTLARRDVPVRVATDVAFRAIAAGWFHTCGLDLDGTVWCWGDNGSGALGTLDPDVHPLPVRLSGMPTLRGLVTGATHTCGIDQGGTAYCWGTNGSGQLGVLQSTERCGQGPCSRQPVPVAGGLTFTSLSAGPSHTCGVTLDGAVYCWGSNQAGKLGNGEERSAAQPTLVTGDHRFRQISVGSTHTCGTTTEGTVLCWGLNTSGQLGTSTEAEACGSTELACAARPLPITSALRFRMVTAGGQHTCAIAESGAGYCWGANGVGQVGNGSSVDQPTPQRVAGAQGFQTISAGDSHTCAVVLSGEVYCWGDNFRAQLGNGGVGLRSLEPTIVSLPGDPR
jgi:alpha-tubulin suppressor-like RCC1 family protein